MFHYSILKSDRGITNEHYTSIILEKTN